MLGPSVHVVLVNLDGTQGISKSVLKRMNKVLFSHSHSLVTACTATVWAVALSVQ